MRFIDLFAGLGGFHVALSQLGHECVFASEIDDVLRQTYQKNFGILPDGDIRKVLMHKIPKHDVLCAGFPCQPFSKAGEQQGLECPKQGDLFDYVVDILEYHTPEFFILENVPNLLRHRQGKTYSEMKDRLEGLGYAVTESRLSPHQFGIPQIRDRVYIVGRRGGISEFSWPKETNRRRTSILSALERNPVDARKISKQVSDCLKIWQEFLRKFPKKEQLPSFPIWSMEFGATYPYEDTTPFAIGTRRLLNYRGSHGRKMRGLTPDERWANLPAYARTEEDSFPDWKIDFIRQNRELYTRHKTWMKEWIPKILEFPPSLQKFEWNCKGEARNVWKYVIQFRASGVRVKRPSTAPSLVAMTTTQVPILGWERRYMTPRECANLQSLSQLKYLPTSGRAFKALGNAVNAEVVGLVASALLRTSERGKILTLRTLPQLAARHLHAAAV